MTDWSPVVGTCDYHGDDVRTTYNNLDALKVMSTTTPMLGTAYCLTDFAVGNMWRKNEKNERQDKNRASEDMDADISSSFIVKLKKII